MNLSRERLEPACRQRAELRRDCGRKGERSADAGGQGEPLRQCASQTLATERQKIRTKRQSTRKKGTGGESQCKRKSSGCVFKGQLGGTGYQPPPKSSRYQPPPKSFGYRLSERETVCTNVRGAQRQQRHQPTAGTERQQHQNSHYVAGATCLSLLQASRITVAKGIPRRVLNSTFASPSCPPPRTRVAAQLQLKYFGCSFRGQLGSRQRFGFRKRGV